MTSRAFAHICFSALLFCTATTTSFGQRQYQPRLDSLADVLGYDAAPLSDRDGDGWEDLLVGAPTRARGRGQVIALSSSTDTVLATIDAPAGVRGFGTSFALADDLDGDGVQDFYVGCYFRSNVTNYSGPNVDVTGREYCGAVVSLSSASLTVIAVIPSPDGGETVGYGYAITALDDVNGDGVSDFAVTAPSGCASMSRPSTDGRIYVQSGHDNSLIWEADPPRNLVAGFGAAIEPCGDRNADGVQELLVRSASGHLGGGLSIFNGATGKVLWGVRGTPSSGGLAGFSAAAVVDDLDADGVSDIVALAVDHESSGTRKMTYRVYGSDRNRLLQERSVDGLSMHTELHSLRRVILDGNERVLVGGIGPAETLRFVDAMWSQSSTVNWGAVTDADVSEGLGLTFCELSGTSGTRLLIGALGGKRRAGGATPEAATAPCGFLVDPLTLTSIRAVRALN